MFTQSNCWELLDPMSPALLEVRSLYESTLDEEERIPWEWIERSIERRLKWQPGKWCPHLLIASNVMNDERDSIHGFAFGAHIPHFGGYISYVGVDPGIRKKGTGTRLFEQMFRLLTLDAAAEGSPLPFVIWESHRPEETATHAEWQMWTARLKLFHRVGGYWMEGLDFLSPNFSGDEEPAVPLQLFVKPVDEPLASFDATRLKEIAAGIHERVYHTEKDDDLYIDTFPPGCLPRLRSALEADRKLVRS